MQKIRGNNEGHMEKDQSDSEKELKATHFWTAPPRGCPQPDPKDRPCRGEQKKELGPKEKEERKNATR